MVYDPTFAASSAALLGVRSAELKKMPAAICRRLGIMGIVSQVSASLHGVGKSDVVKEIAQGGRGAEGCALCLPNRAPRPSCTVGLLRRVMVGLMSDGAVELRAFARSSKPWVTNAGAFVTQGLIGILRASCHASPTERGRISPLKPCMNGLPAHASYFIMRRICNSGLLACADGTGFKKLC
jgi:hypothetical protein